MTSRALYLVLVAAVALERVLELRVSHRNERALRAEGGSETGPRTFRVMVLLHVSLFLLPPLEVFILDRPFVPALAGGAIALLLAATLLRLAVIRTLGRFWSARAVVSPRTEVCDRGPYRFLRHPNYLAVGAEILALPLVHTAWVSAIVLTAWNGAVLAARVREEEQALFAIPGYAEKMGGKARIIPGVF